MRPLLRWIGLGWLVAATGCSGSQAAPPPPGPLPGGSTAELVSPDGGALTSPDGVTIAVPAGAIATPTYFSVMPGTNDYNGMPTSISMFPISLDGGEFTLMVVGPAFDLAPVRPALAMPVTVTLLFDPSKLPAGASGADVVVFTSDVGDWGNSDLTALPTTLVDSTHVSVSTAQLGTFGPAVPIPYRVKCAGIVLCDVGQSCVMGACR